MPAFFLYMNWHLPSSDQHRSLIPCKVEVATAPRELCSICLELIEQGEAVGVLQRCKHAYHAACITDWLNVNDKCPVCRATA